MFGLVVYVHCRCAVDTCDWHVYVLIGDFLLWIICGFCVLCFSCFRIYSLRSPACGHLLGWADLFALVGDVYCIFSPFPCGILGQVWYLIVSFPNLCRLSFFDTSLLLFLNIILINLSILVGCLTPWKCRIDKCFFV